MSNARQYLLASPQKTVIMVDRIGLPDTLKNKGYFCLATPFSATATCGIPLELSSKTAPQSSQTTEPTHRERTAI